MISQTFDQMAPFKEIKKSMAPSNNISQKTTIKYA